MTQPFETLEVQCLGCGRKLRVPAARRRRAWRLGHATADFCGKGCSSTYIARTGRKAQDELAKVAIAKLKQQP